MSRTDVRSRVFEFIAITLAILWIADRAWLRTNLKTLATELTDADEQIARLNSTVRELQIAPINRQKLHELQEAGAETEIGVVGISFIHPPALSTTSMTLKDLPNVTSLTIRSPGMTSSILQPVDEMTSLKYCFLTGDCLIDADEEVCAILSKLPSLQSVELAHASFSMDVYHHIAQHPGLRLVSLNESDVNDQQVVILAENPRIEILYLRGTQITPECIPALAKMTHLRELALPVTFSVESVRKLKELLPECLIAGGDRAQQ